MNLSTHFTLEEFILSQHAVRAGIANLPAAEARSNLGRLAWMLEEVRHQLGDHAILINSGYRCPRLNTLIGSVSTSQHALGLAVDFLCPGYGSPRAICEVLQESPLQFDQLICEGSWVHISLAETARPARREVLTAVFRVGQKTQYTRGLA